MSRRDQTAAIVSERDRYEQFLDYYSIALAVAMMLLGLRQWAVILGIVSSSGGAFEAMPTAWKLATMHLAVVDLVAAVGLWMRVAWGKVLWVFAALSEIVLHTVFIGTFGGDLLVVAFHLATLVAYVVLLIQARRHPAR
jgi:hypothetical protein